MKWVTRERPKIDRIACPWLILRFIDRGAERLALTPQSAGLYGISLGLSRVFGDEGRLRAGRARKQLHAVQIGRLSDLPLRRHGRPSRRA